MITDRDTKNGGKAIFGGELQTVLALPVSPAVDLFCDNPNGSRCWQTAPLTSASSGPLLQSALTLNGSTYAEGLSLIVTFLVALSFVPKGKDIY